MTCVMHHIMKVMYNIMKACVMPHIMKVIHHILKVVYHIMKACIMHHIMKGLYHMTGVDSIRKDVFIIWRVLIQQFGVKDEFDV